ncbi:MAG: hypothetical protein D6732_26620 [Methanobacteriota archaeon]|nr:MAG: hypothetical protein D6732_26620 [Euryarchaeota archaeon]
MKFGNVPSISILETMLFIMLQLIVFVLILLLFQFISIFWHLVNIHKPFESAARTSKSNSDRCWKHNLIWRKTMSYEKIAELN